MSTLKMLKALSKHVEDPQIPNFEPQVPNHAIVLVQFGIPHLLYHQGNQLNYWVAEMGKEETALAMMGEGHQNGVFVWSGHVDGWRSYEGEYDEELVCVEEHPVTEEEWKSFTADEIVWDFEEMRAWLNWSYRRNKPEED